VRKETTNKKVIYKMRGNKTMAEAYREISAFGGLGEDAVLAWPNRVVV
jgi:hypothetical protein